MPPVYVEAPKGPVLCGHSLGTVGLETAAKVTVGGRKVLLMPVAPCGVSGCTTPVTTDTSGTTLTSPCSTATLSAAAATKLVIAGRQPLLPTVAGTSDGFLAKATSLPVVATPPAQAKLLTL